MNYLIIGYLLITIFFQSLEKKNYLPPELVAKLKSKTLSNDSCESIEDNLGKIIKIITQPIRSNENNDNTSFLSCEVVIVENN